MPVIFKHSQPRAKASTGFRSTSNSFGSQQQRPYLGVIEGAPGHGRRLRQRGSIFLHRGSVRARHSISRLRHKGSSLHKYIQNPKLLVKLAKRIYHERHLKHLIPLFFVLLYMFLGAFLFFSIEAATERERLSMRDTVYEADRLMFVKRMEEIIVDTASPPNTSKRRHFVEEAVDHLRTQLGHGPPPPAPEWTFLTSMYFAGTIFTTIGYGDIACETFVGQLATVAYAIFGIPLMLITLNELGKFLYKTINEFMAMLSRRCQTLPRFSKCLGAKNNKETDAETAEKGGLMQNHRRKSTSEEMKAVSFKLNKAPEEELSLQMDVAEDPPGDAAESGGSPLRREPSPSGHNKENNASLQKRSGGDQSGTVELGILMEEETSDDNEEQHGENIEDNEDVDDEQYNRWHSNNTHIGALGGSSHHHSGEPAPRMHVMVAIVTTFAWIFLCAALFKLWEHEWTYWNSLYFMFISLLTIGLGDVNVQRRDLMVLCFIFVIIGLSLVSMCINVIQSSLEDLYRKLLMKVLADYQASLNKDGSHKNASIGVMKALGGSKTAKFLMPLMSENTKRAVMQQVQEDAKEAGIEIPPIFENFETINELIANKDTADDEEARSAIIEEILRPIMTAEASIQLEDHQSVAAVDLRENHTQTEIIRREDKTDQTVRVEQDEMAVQTEIGGPEETPLGVEVGQQTEEPPSTPMVEEAIQTVAVSTREAETITSPRLESRGHNVDTQTEQRVCLDEEVQTFATRLGTFDGVTQTEEKPVKNQRIQTPIPVLADAEAQTDEINPDLEKIHGSRIREARRRIRRAFRSHSKGNHGEEPTMSGWQEFSSDESIDWDPYDGLHAERQKPVSQLKKMFDQGDQQGIQSHRPSASSIRRTGEHRPSTSSSIRRDSEFRRDSGFQRDSGFRRKEAIAGGLQKGPPEGELKESPEGEL